MCCLMQVWSSTVQAAATVPTFCLLNVTRSQLQSLWHQPYRAADQVCTHSKCACTPILRGKTVKTDGHCKTAGVACAGGT